MHVRMREFLVASLREASPTDPTLCEGWEARHVAAHIMLRQGAPWGMSKTALAELADEAAEPDAYLRLVAQISAPPPVLSPHAWAGNVVNVAEFYVHAQDVIRGTWTGPRGEDAPAPDPSSDADVAKSLWRQLGVTGRFAFRGAAAGVVAAVPGLGERRLSRPRAGAPTVHVTGPIGELVLYAFGRGRVAAVTLDGAPSALSTLDSVVPGPLSEP
jgi:uncharacterized protein (TIGR03085 family)